jgi:parallel beta-helix repeat protein
MISFVAGLLFAGIFCLYSGAFGYVSSGETCPASEVVFIDPSVPEIEKIVAQLPQGAEVVRLSSNMDGVGQISAHLAKKRDLSAIHIISHGNGGHFVLNGKRIDSDFLRDHQKNITSWGGALSENGDILLYACNLAATDEGRLFVDRFSGLTDADVAASTDVTGGIAFNGNWNLEYSMGQIDSIAVTVDPNINIKLPCTWTGAQDSTWNDTRNWSGPCSNNGLPDTGDEVEIDTATSPTLGSNPNMNVSTTFSKFTINSSKTLNIVTNGAINTTAIVTINGTVNAGDDVPISISAGGQILLNGAITSGADSAVTLNSGVNDGIALTGASTITSTSGPVTFKDIINGASTLTIDAGTGGIVFEQSIGAVTNLTTLTITKSGGTTFQGNVTTDTSVVLTDTTDGENITFTGALVTPTLTTTDQGYNVNLHGGCTITNSTNFSNTGTTTIGNGAGDSSTFTGGLDATAGPLSVAGTITVSISDRQMRLGTTTVSDDSTLVPPASEGVGTILIFLEGPVTINDAKTLIAGNGNNTSISFGSTINSASGGTGNLTINNNATFSNHVGGTTPIGTLTLTAGNVTAGTSNVTTGTIAVDGGTFGQAASPTGNWDVDNVTIASEATMNATTGTFSVSGNWNNSGEFDPKTGTVTLDGTNQTIIGATTFYNLTKNVTSAATLTFPSATTTAVTNTLNLSGATGQLLSLRSSTSGTQWQIDPQGTRTIAYLDVQDSNNESGTAIDTVGKNIFDSGRNTNWTFEAPTVTTQAVSGIGTTSATGNGTITSLGANNPTAHGVCWNTSGTPTISDNIKDNGAASATGSFTASMTGLSPGTTYHVRAFATNTVGTSYGADLTFTAHTVAAGTYYVNVSTGSDSNNGSSGAPWKTLHHAIAQINGGAAGTYILIMAAGTYKVGDSGETDTAIILSQSNVTIIGEDDHTIGANSTTTIIDGTGTSNDGWISGINTTGSNITIRGLSIKNFSASGQYGIYMSASTTTEVANCKIFDNHTGIHIAAGSDNFEIRNNDIYHNTIDGIYVIGSDNGNILHNTIYYHEGTDGDDGIAVLGCSPSIKRNKIYDNDTGIRVEANSTASPDIWNNLIYETTNYTMNYGILVKGNYGSVAKPTIYHNSIDGGSGDGIAIEESSPSGGTLAPVIKYNIITRFDGVNSVGIDGAAGTTCSPDYNDVWGNTQNYDGNVCTAGTNDISQDPENGTAGPLAATSPCINAIPTTNPPGDPVTMDYLGYKRPKSSGYDMGAYEYIAQQTYTDTLPGGTGIVTDYRIFTIPLDIGTGQDMKNTMEGVLGSYNPATWRVFARTTSGDVEMNTQAFKSLDLKSGIGLWGITVLTNSIKYTGTLAPDAIYYEMKLAPGWHLFAVPWPNTSINLGKIYVTDGVNQYTITDATNTLTQQKIWDYTGTGSTGYTVRNTGAFSLGNGVGFYIKVLGSSNIILSIPPNNSSDPPNNSSASTSHAVSYESPESVHLTDDPEPPPLPGGPYGPVPNIKANKEGGRLDASGGTPVSITVSLDPGDQAGENADWWVVAHTPFAAPLNWYSYVYPEGWRPGIYPCVQTPLFQVAPFFEVLNMALPSGDYTFYFAVDGNMDGEPDSTWQNTVEVKVE